MIKSLFPCCYNHPLGLIEEKLNNLNSDQLNKIIYDQNELESLILELFKTYCKENQSKQIGKDEITIKKQMSMNFEEYCLFVKDLNILDYEKEEIKKSILEFSSNLNVIFQDVFYKLCKNQLISKIDKILGYKSQSMQKFQRISVKSCTVNEIEAFDEELQLKKDLPDLDIYITEEEIIKQNENNFKFYLSLFHKFLIDCGQQSDQNNKLSKFTSNLPRSSIQFKEQYEKTGQFLSKNALKQILIETIVEEKNNNSNNKLKNKWNYYINIQSDIYQKYSTGIKDQNLRKYFMITQSEICENNFKNAFENLWDLDEKQQFVIRKNEDKISKNLATQNLTLSKDLKKTYQNYQSELADSSLLAKVKLIQLLTDSSISNLPIIISNFSDSYIEFLREQLEESKLTSSNETLQNRQFRIYNSFVSSKSNMSLGESKLYETFNSTLNKIEEKVSNNNDNKNDSMQSGVDSNQTLNSKREDSQFEHSIDEFQKRGKTKPVNLEEEFRKEDNREQDQQF